MLSIQTHFEAVGFDMKITFTDGSVPDVKQYGFEIRMRRILSPFFLKSYIPSTSIVLISGISFMIPLSAIPGRVGLSVTLFLTLANIFINKTVCNMIFQSQPNSDYYPIIDN